MIVGWPQAAFAYRPFDSTDPAVADPGELEIEFSPVSFRRDNSGDTWIAPQLKVNYGIAPNWEFVIEGQGEHPQFDGAPSVMVDNAVFLKHVVREGTLQEQAGPSIAIEFGALLPGINDEDGAWRRGGRHYRESVVLGSDLLHGRRRADARQPRRDVPGHDHRRPARLGCSSGGRNRLRARIRHSTEVVAALAGVIWEARDGLAFDFAVRQAAVDGEPETEIRVGLTFAFSTR